MYVPARNKGSRAIRTDLRLPSQHKRGASRGGAGRSSAGASDVRQRGPVTSYSSWRCAAISDARGRAAPQDAVEFARIGLHPDARALAPCAAAASSARALKSRATFACMLMLRIELTVLFSFKLRFH